MVPVLLHIAAAVLWIVCILFSVAVGMRVEMGDEDGSKVGGVVLLLIAAVAFTLQVLA